MKKLVCLFLLLWVGSNAFDAFAQKDTNQVDLEALYTAIQKTPSYKKLLKGDKAYQQLYEEVKLKIVGADEKQAFKELSRLIFAINDNHLGFYRTLDTAVKMSYISMIGEKIGSFLTRLQHKSESDLEGIYRASNENFGLHVSGDNTYQMVRIRNRVVIAEVFYTSYGGYDMLLYSSKSTPYQLVKNTRLVNGTLSGTSFTKSREKKFSVLDKGSENFEYKIFNDKIGYLRLSSFSSSTEHIKKSEVFYQKIADTLETANLIVDVRDNGGGGYKTSQKFIKLLKKYKGNIFMLQNASTVSNAEQFILALKSKKNVTTLGEKTRGTITFGSNYGKKIVLPSGRFTFYPTDMKGTDRNLAYESKGINPDVALDVFKSDWISQTLEYIEKKF